MGRSSHVLAQLEAEHELHVLALKCAAREREHRVLLQKYEAERELRIWCQQHCLQPLFADSELGVFIDDQQSAWLARVVANPLQTEFAES